VLAASLANRTESRHVAAVSALIALMAVCWVLLIPPGAGPDEASHLVRAGALARGVSATNDSAISPLDLYLLPDSYTLPDAGCHAFDSFQPVTCAAAPVSDGTEILLASRGDAYPIWGHLAGGLASRLPGMSPIWWARLAGAAIPIGLAAWSLSIMGRRRPVASAALLIGLTPMAWSTFAGVNPSAMAIGGAVGLWTGLLFGGRAPTASASWLTAAGWAALALPRRDGLIWACLTLVLVLLATDRTAIAWWRSHHAGAQMLIGASTGATVVWGVASESRVSRLVALAPLIVVTAELARWGWGRWVRTARDRALALAGAAMVSAVTLVAVLRARPGGWSTDLAVRIVGQTGENMIEAIGLLGWLDTPLPWLAIVAWLFALGILAARSLFNRPGPAIWATVLLATTILTSWIFELYQGNTSGQYWQGRYSVPLIIGIPMLLAVGSSNTHVERNIARLAAGIALTVLNIAAWAAARRWGVGNDGSLLPWRWDTIHQPVAPIVLLVVLAGASACLWLLLYSSADNETQPRIASAR
jgi:hypothetical protein